MAFIVIYLITLLATVAMANEKCGIVPEFDMDNHNSSMSVPWHAAIYLNLDPPDDEYSEDAVFMMQCGGTILTHKYIITAAHCLLDEDTQQTYDVAQLMVAVGKQSRHWDDSTQYTQRIRVRRQHWISANLEYHTFNRDLVLLELSTSIRFNQHIVPICLKVNQQPLTASMMGRTAGWGEISGYPSVDLKVMDVLVLPHKECYQRLPKHLRDDFNKNKICTASSRHGSIGYGDNGGGLVLPQLDDTRIRYYLLGVTSIGNSQKHGLLTISTDVAFYLNHILEIIL